MNSKADFIRSNSDGGFGKIDWSRHDPKAAQARLAASAKVASHRRLQTGAARFVPSEHLINATVSYTHL